MKDKWSEDGCTSISPTGNQQPADTDNISALDHLSVCCKVTDNSANYQVAANEKYLVEEVSQHKRR